MKEFKLKGDVIMFEMIFSFILNQEELVYNILWGVSEGSNLLEEKITNEQLIKLEKLLALLE